MNNEGLMELFTCRIRRKFSRGLKRKPMALINWGFLLLLTELLDESHWLTLQASRKLTPDSACEELHQALIVHVKKLIEVNSTVSKLTEGPLLLKISSSLVRHVVELFLL